MATPKTFSIHLPQLDESAMVAIAGYLRANPLVAISAEVHPAEHAVKLRFAPPGLVKRYWALWLLTTSAALALGMMIGRPTARTRRT